MLPFNLAAPLILAGIVSWWIAWADTKFANSARDAALYVRDNYGAQADKVSFQGHWGFQYYMQQFGFNPVDTRTYAPQPGRSWMVIPENNTNTFPATPQFIASTKGFQFEMKSGAATMESSMGAGFYFDGWGPLPYASGPVSPERYWVVELVVPTGRP